MFTLGYSFFPWREARAIADGPSILAYVRETAERFGIDRRIRYRQRVRAASWSSKDARWTVEVEAGEGGERVVYTASFLYMCSGYYSYEDGYTPELPGRDAFAGRVIHPQAWPEDLDYRGKRVVVIGSGATAVTVVPALAKDAGHVTMLQRSPTYYLILPNEDRLSDALRAVLPERAAHRAVRMKNAGLALFFYQLCRRAPRLARKLLLGGVARELPEGYDISTHFNPRYDPWDQRLCLVPDGDLFKAIRAGKVSMVTGRIKAFREHGIALESGEEIPADIIVTATGLQLLVGGGVPITVDGRRVEPGKAFIYKHVMLSGVPNLAVCVGYTNASWTLRAEISHAYVCRLLEHMDAKGYRSCVPRIDPEEAARPGAGRPAVDLASGYVMRRAAEFPKQGARQPWTVRQNYFVDLLHAKLDRVEDGVVVFSA
jgi:cation diffusion facilitator CzcD-associated flavoprotein CzcO